MVIDLDEDSILGSLLEGKWKLVRRIGRGGMGQVFQVEHARMGIVKCVKILRPGSDEVLGKRFEREVLLARQIRHPNVIRIDDFGVDTSIDGEGIPYYIMEFVEGASLRDLLAERELPWKRACAIVRQVALGAAAAHERDIIHRDIKPENVVVGPDDRVTVLDFGIAKLRSPETREDMLTLTRKGEIWATPQYMSPEQAMASSDLTPRSDIYSLGVVLFECLAGELPFLGDSAREFIIAHIQRDVPSLTARRPDLRFPEGLEALTSSMLAKRLEDRPASMAEVASFLEDLESGRVPSLPVPAPREEGPAGRKGARGRGRTAAAPAATRRARPRRVVVVPHPPEGDSRERGFPVKAHLFVNLGDELHEHLIGRSRLTLGRKTSNDVLVPDTLASKVHAEVLEEKGRFYVLDRHSRNGTFLDRTRIEGRVTLPPVQTLRIGNTYLLFCRGDVKPEDHYSFCPEGHPSDRKARFCGACGAAMGENS